MMLESEKSDLAIVAGKSANNVVPAAEQSAARLAAAESMERRAGTKGNADWQSTHWTQSQGRVSQALDRIRQVTAVWTRGGSRMRESRTYGSVRGARESASLPLPYPVPLNGDHIEFERAHAGTPLHERPDWPLPSFDARDWAKAFLQAYERGSDDFLCEANMIG